MIKIAFWLSVLLAFPVFAAGSMDQIESWSVNVGNHTNFFNKVQSDGNGNLRKIEFAPTIGAGIVLPISEKWKFDPEFNWVVPHSGNSHIIKNQLMFRADFGYDLLQWLRLRIGTSLMILNQHGTGGTTKVNNGNSTSNFYYPDENRSSINNTFDLGVEWVFDPWSLRLQTYTYSLFKEDRRQVSYTLFVSYHWDKKP